MIKVAIVDEQPEFPLKLAKKLEVRQGVTATALAPIVEAEQSINQDSPQILIFGPSITLEKATKLVKQAKESGELTICILVAEELTTGLLQNALRAGFSDVINDEPNEILEAFDRAAELMESQPDLKNTDDGDRDEPAKVITFFSTKGGVGKTVFSVNTAIGLAKADKRVVLLDLDHSFGDVGVMLGLKPERTVSDLIPAIDRLDTEMLNGLLTNHQSGFKALLAPVKHDAAKPISEDHVRKIIEVARLAGEFVIIDTPASFADNTLTILDNSDVVCLIVTLDVPSVKSAQITLQTLKLLNYPEQKIKLLLNRSDSKVSLSPTDVEKHLLHKIDVQIPSDRSVPRTVNEGMPLLMEDSGTPISRALEQIVELAGPDKKPIVRNNAEQVVK